MKRLLCLLALVPALSFAQKVEVGLTGGTTGIGFELGYKPSNYLKVRAGFNYMPKLTLNRSYSMQSVSDIPFTEEEDDRIFRLCKRLGEFINSDQVDPYVGMEHRFNFWNTKLLFDVYPFKKKNWHFTAGAYVGPRKLGKAINMHNEAPTMMAINVYNGLFDQCGDDPDYIPAFEFEGLPSLAIPPEIWEQFLKYGRVVVPMGTFDDGTPHYLVPDKAGVMQATIITHIVKPYLGVGYDFQFGPEKRWDFSVDAGVLILGKVPHVRDNSGVCLTHDVHGIGGDVGQLIRLVKKFPVYPNLELRLSYTIR